MVHFHAALGSENRVAKTVDFLFFTTSTAATGPTDYLILKGFSFWYTDEPFPRIGHAVLDLLAG